MSKFSLFLLLASLASAQTAATPGNASTAPIHVLYRTFLRHVAALDAAADKLDAAGKPNGADLRGWYERTLLLSPKETALLKQHASSCVHQLDQQDAKAAQLIASAPTGGKTPPTGLAQLEDERTAISNGCIQALQGTFSPDTFRKLDVYVRTAVATHFSVTQPPLVAPIPPGGRK